MTHKFHIPVLGLAFSIDSPIKVAQFGISSAVSIVDDELTERLREYHSNQNQMAYQAINKNEFDSRAKRFTAYLDMLQDIIDRQVATIKSSSFDTNDSLQQYFKLLPNQHPAYQLYQDFITIKDQVKKKEIAAALKNMIKAGEIEVNIMSKVDKANKDEKGQLLESTFSDATAALRGFTNSRIESTVILSAGMNPRLYNYLADLPQFLPNSDSIFHKKVCLKVSDYRSANIQARYLAKKGVWVSEFRIESGLNCGGHAFATEGFLLGPILEEFKQNRQQLQEELFTIYSKAIQSKNINIQQIPAQKLTAQGGIGTSAEQQFLLNYYQLDRIGWGSPFLLVPEATTVDEQTLASLVAANKDDFYLSGASPLGIPFHNFRKSTAETNRLERIKKNRAGAPCTKRYLISNDDFSLEPICTASREYQNTKLKELELLKELNYLDPNNNDFEKLKREITEKTCLCEGLATSAYLKYNIAKKKENTAVAICPGPNTAYFSNIYSLSDMVNHIYGRTDLLQDVDRSSVFINELRLYIEYIEKYKNNNPIPDLKKKNYINSFIDQLRQGINYYKKLSAELYIDNESEKDKFMKELDLEESKLKNQSI